MNMKILEEKHIPLSMNEWEHHYKIKTDHVQVINVKTEVASLILGRFGTQREAFSNK